MHLIACLSNKDYVVLYIIMRNRGLFELKQLVNRQWSLSQHKSRAPKAEDHEMILELAFLANIGLRESHVLIC